LAVSAFESLVICNVPMRRSVPVKKPACETTEQQCPFLDQCDFIHENATKTPELIRRIQSHYCTKTDYCRCARFQLCKLLGADAVPPLMLPEQIDWARQIIEEYECDTTTDEQTAEAR
jgi:hypothetical protein